MQDCQLVIVGPFGRVDLTFVTGFTCEKISPDLGVGWSGQFEIERGSAVGDEFVARIDEANSQPHDRMGYCSLYQYVSDCDGSTSTYQHSGALFVGTENIGPHKLRVTFDSVSRRKILP